MKKTRFSETKIVSILKKQEAGIEPTLRSEIFPIQLRFQKGQERTSCDQTGINLCQYGFEIRCRY